MPIHPSWCPHSYLTLLLCPIAPALFSLLAPSYISSLRPTHAGSIITPTDHPASSQAWSTWRMGPVSLWTTTHLTRSSAGIPTRTSASSVRTVRRARGLGRPCPASTWRKVRAHRAVGGQSVPVGIPPTPGRGMLAGSRAGDRWLLPGGAWPWDRRGRSCGLPLLPQCWGAQGLFLALLLSKPCLHRILPWFTHHSLGKPKPQVCYEWVLMGGPQGLLALFSWCKCGRMLLCLSFPWERWTPHWPWRVCTMAWSWEKPLEH